MDNCLFCQMIDHKIPVQVLYEDDLVIAIPDLHPLAEKHILVIPKIHIANLNEFTPEQNAWLGDLLLSARKVAFQQGIGESGYRLVLNTNRGGGQSIFHLHIHLLAGGTLGPGLMVKGL